jgi:hypothetical protein
MAVLYGCTQNYSDFKEKSISLEPGDLEQGGLAFITPSTVSGPMVSAVINAIHRLRAPPVVP